MGEQVPLDDLGLAEGIAILYGSLLDHTIKNMDLYKVSKEPLSFYI